MCRDIHLGQFVDALDETRGRGSSRLRVCYTLLMRIIEIQQLKSQSPALRMALHDKEAYRFLREQVQAQLNCYPICEHCLRVVLFTLISPFNAPHPGWCVDCVLGAFYTDDMPLYVPPKKEIPPMYQPKAYWFVNDGQGWRDQDGNPINIDDFIRFP